MYILVGSGFTKKLFSWTGWRFISSVAAWALPKNSCHRLFAKPQKGSCWLGLCQKGQTLHLGALFHRKRNASLCSPPPHLIYLMARFTGCERGAQVTDRPNNTYTLPLLEEVQFEDTNVSLAVSPSNALPCYIMSMQTSSCNGLILKSNQIPPSITLGWRKCPSLTEIRARPSL
jgi:hypothetical protein